MIVIDTKMCTGCGACMEVCPGSALYLVEGRATVDQALCRGCGACVAACPAAAITFTACQELVAQAARLPAVRPESEIIRVTTPLAPLPGSRVMPIVGAALGWAGREILPRLADLFLNRLDRQAVGRQVTVATPRRDTARRGGQGRRQQHRQRGGRRD